MDNIASNPNISEGFVVGYAIDSQGECDPLTVSHSMWAAYDILTDADVSPENAARLARAADAVGQDPRLGQTAEDLARKFVLFRRIARGEE